MDDSKILFKWKTNYFMHSRKIERAKLLSVFQGLVDGFEDDNEISKAFVRLIPDSTIIYIDNDANATQEIPLVIFFADNNDEAIIKVIRYHKIVWSILNKCMDEEDEKKEKESEAIN